ncbi:MAG: ParA family protein [bacterium]|nr:ParA family protein [bacterium]
MTRIIAVAVPKGGVGKTTTTLNLGAALAEQGQRVLLIDCDPQGNLSQALDADTTGSTLYSEMHAFLETYTPSLERAIRPTRAGVDIVPTDVRLNLANGELTLAMHGEFVLQKLIRPIAPNYDVVLLDTLPYLGVLVVNTLVAAQEVIIPMEAEYFATQSVGLMIDQVALMRRADLNAHLRVTGVLLTMVDQRTIINRQVVEYARREFGVDVPVFKTMIKRSVRFPESQALHQTILQYEPHGEGARAYRALAEEIVHGVA